MWQIFSRANALRTVARIDCCKLQFIINSHQSISLQTVPNVKNIRLKRYEYSVQQRQTDQIIFCCPLHQFAEALCTTFYINSTIQNICVIYRAKSRHSKILRSRNQNFFSVRLSWSGAKICREPCLSLVSNRPITRSSPYREKIQARRK